MRGKTIGSYIGLAIAVTLSVAFGPHVVVCFFLGFGLTAAGMHYGEELEELWRLK